LAWAAVLAVTACRPAPLAHAAASTELLTKAVVEALGGRDAERLRALALSEAEFRNIVWPDLPAARPERNLPVEYVWADLRAKSDAGLKRTLHQHGGAPLELVRVAFAGPHTRYRNYVVHRDAVVTLRRGGVEEAVRLFGSVIERNGQFKVFSYVAE
jgi:hypothetical protein